MRSSWKFSFSQYNFSDIFHNNEKVFLDRHFMLTPCILNSGLTYNVYNGKSFSLQDSKGSGVYFKAGSFSFTKAIGSRIHLTKKKASKR